MKKKIKKNYFSGGEIAMVADYATKTTNDYINAANYKFQPGQPAPQMDWAKMLTSGVVGAIPEMIKYAKDRKQRSAYVASATPGNYKNGGPVSLEEKITGKVRSLPKEGQPFINLGGDTYLDPYNNRYVTRDPIFGYYSGNTTPADKNLPKEIKAERDAMIKAHLAKYPNKRSLAPDIESGFLPLKLSSTNNYQQGGPIQPTPRPVSRGVRPDGYSVYRDIPVVTPPVPVRDPFNPFPVINPPAILPVRVPSGGSSKSKSKDRYREMATGGPIDAKISQSEYTMKSKTRESGSDASGRKTLRRGMRDEGSGEITMMQQFLLNKGFYKGEVDGIYGAKTEAAVKEYQKYFNKEAKEPMYYTKDGVNSETIGRGGKRIKEDGIVGDQTRTALMYRERPKLPAKPTPVLENVEFPEGERRVKYQTSDYTPNNFPDSPMNYQGGLEMLGLAASVPEAGAIITGMATRGATMAGAEVIGNMLSTGTRMNLPEKINVIGNTIPNTIGRTGGRYFAPKTPSGYGTRVGYASGGQLDAQLSDSSFQVKGNPNVTDGNHYPEFNANLDHNEVVKTEVNQAPFVFSNKLKMPNGKSFADAARKLEISTGKSEKILKNNPNDPFARATIAHNENRADILAKEQEALATAMGLRDNTKNYANGGFVDGPDDPPYTFPGERHTNMMNPVNIGTGKRRRIYTADDFPGYLPAGNAGFIDLGRDGMYYDPYTKNFVVRNSKGMYVKVQPKEGTVSINTANNTVKDIVTDKVFDVNQHLNYTPSAVQSSTPQNPIQQATAPLSSTQSVASSERPDIYGGLKDLAAPAGSSGPRRSRATTNAQPSPAPVTNPLSRFAPGTNTNELPPSDLPAGTLDPIDPSYENPDLYDPNDTSVLGAMSDYNKNLMGLQTIGKPNATQSASGTTTPAVEPVLDRLTDKFTIGDALQAVEVGSKFAQLSGGPERERAYYDNTNITKENFDPSNALYQSQRNFQLGQNTLQNSSINQNRSFLNNLYVGKLNQDSDILTKYNQMNQSSRTQQEQRQADQRRYNIGQTVYTNDVNARNRGAYKNAIDTAFTSLGNLGQNLNQKKQGTDALNILRASYPEVYARIMKGINGK